MQIQQRWQPQRHNAWGESERPAAGATSTAEEGEARTPPASLLRFGRLRFGPNPIHAGKWVPLCLQQISTAMRIRKVE